MNRHIGTFCAIYMYVRLITLRGTGTGIVAKGTILYRFIP